MKKMLLLSVWLFSAVRCQQPKVHRSAQEGGPVHISCPYDSGYEKYPKFFSKGDYGKRKTLLRTTTKMCKEGMQKGKYELCDDTKKRILHITIYKLTLKDAGTYWCEIDANFFDPKTEIELRVYKAPAAPKPPPVKSSPPVSTTVQTITRNQQQSERTPAMAINTTLWSTSPADVHTGNELYLIAAAAAAAVAVAVLGLLVFWFFRPRKHRHDTAEEDAPAATRYEENICSVSSPSDEAGDQRINENVHLLYSTICFSTEAIAEPRRLSTSAAGPSDVYATITHPQT